ncbi:unnamed protein product, partial [Owenia fusiformis]
MMNSVFTIATLYALFAVFLQQSQSVPIQSSTSTQATTSDGTQENVSLWQPPNNRSLEEWLQNNGQPEEEWKKVQEMMQQIQQMNCLKNGGCPASDAPSEITDGESSMSDLMDDDIILTIEQAQFILEQMQSRKKRKVHSFDRFPTKKWSTREPIKYKFDGQHTVFELTKIKGALSHWEEQTCLTFQEVSRNEIVSGSHIIFTKHRGCSSFYGRQERIVPQPVSLTAACIGWFGTMAHEIGHAIGFWHEHARPDRDDHIKVMYNNIRNGRQSQFIKQNWLNTDSYGVGYDLGSAMHYHSRAFTATGQNTIETINPLYKNTIGQRVALSFADVKVANLAYCADKCHRGLSQQCQHGGYQDPKACDRCRCADGWTGKYCEDLAPPKEAKCGGVLFAETENTMTQSIQSPGYNDGKYENGQECNWLIQAPAGSRVVLYFVDTFGVYCTQPSVGNACFHWVEVKYKNNKEQTGPRFCCYSTPSDRVTSEGNEMQVLFRANHTASRYKRKGFKARYYAEPINECESSPCTHGGQCVDGVNEYTCKCPKGFGGKNCEKEIETDICFEKCMNGGTCKESENDAEESFKCLCTKGFTGPTCEIVAVTSDWSTWSDCSNKCGGCGMRRRTRKITTSLFSKVNTESTSCNAQRCPATDDCDSKRICRFF